MLLGPDSGNDQDERIVRAPPPRSHMWCTRLAGAAQAMRDDMGDVLRWPHEILAREEDLGRARTALAHEAFDIAFAEGRALHEDAAVAYAQRAHGERRRPNAGWESLTPTESEVVRLVAMGLTNKQVSAEILMGAETVKTHLSRVYDKLGVWSRAAISSQYAARSRVDATD